MKCELRPNKIQNDRTLCQIVFYAYHVHCTIVAATELTLGDGGGKSPT